MAVRGITLVQLILERRPYGEDGPKWYHRWTFKLIVVLQINLSDGILRLAFVHYSPCNMLWWKPNVPIGTEQLRKLGNVLFYLDEFKPYLESSYADGM